MLKTLDYKSSQVAYTVNGSGQPVMLVHGFAEDGNVWRYQLAFLQQHCLVIVPHLPGSGLSPYNAALQSMDDFADCLQAILLQEGVTKCIMLGHSMGGYITLAFAEKCSENLTSFGFVHSTAFADSEEKKQNRLKGIRMMEQHGGHAFIKSTTPNLFSTGYKQRNEGEVESLIEDGRNFTNEALQQYYRTMMARPDRTGVLHKSRVPVLFIAGTEDVAAPLNDILKQVHLPLIAYIHILQHTGHMGMWEATGEVNKYVLEFIKNTGE